MRGHRRPFPLYLLDGHAGSAAPEPLLLGDTDLCARLAALAVEVLRARLPEVLNRHALAAPPPTDALGLCVFALQYSQHFASALDMPPAAFGLSVEWLCGALRALRNGFYASFGARMGGERRAGGGTELEIGLAIVRSSALVHQGALPGSSALRNLHLLRAHVAGSRPAELMPSAPPTAPPAWVRERVQRSRHDGNSPLDDSAAARVAAKWVRAHEPVATWLESCLAVLQPVAVAGGAVAPGTQWASPVHVGPASPGAGALVAVSAGAVQALVEALEAAADEDEVILYCARSARRWAAACVRLARLWGGDTTRGARRVF
ncbi:hypothetical protein T492DRAFT_834738 [Pavlovales sp. CCMP2436]|nr:hypothetical protein T492DRAFT_834738 [Pavlovales sp. CCMP2436]